MNTTIPPVEELSQRLKSLKGVELEQLASSSGVPVSTLWKIRIGATPNPGIETVRKFYALLPAAQAAAPVTEQPTA
jgi:transcriptional regulator with XRE-family HTH domain